ncbi:MAG: ATP-grasp domain-containing protein [Gammaproteobacteria bacterium]|nr:ATP-grasp domain-containing protein [Gammaproteobacteria bacterium]
MTADKTMVLFGYDWDGIEFGRLAQRWPQLHAGFDLFSFPSNARLAWFDIERFVALAALRAKLRGATGVVSNHEQFGALSAALLAENMGWPGSSVDAVLAMQHKLHAREVLQRVAPEANVPYARLEADYGAPIPGGLTYPSFVKPVKAAFSVLAKTVRSREELYEHTRFSWQELWVIRHLVEPFEKIVRKRLPEAGTAHSLMLEDCLHGRQYCFDGYCFEGRVKRLGIVDAIMYPGTDAFMRWEYPSHLPESLQAQAEDIAARFLAEVGFTHGLFNMEFVVDEHSGQVKVIEFNPRMAAQFSDLYARVDGLRLHEMALALSHGIDPATLPTDEPRAQCATSFVYRSFDESAQVHMPSAAQRRAFSAAHGDGLLLQFPKKSSEIQRDFKWLRSYRYGIMHLGGDDPGDLQQRCEHASALLGWPAPYVDHVIDLPGVDAAAVTWPVVLGTENSTG